MKLTEILGLFREGKATAKSHIKKLLEMALVDNHFDQRESELLDKLAKKYGVSENELGRIKKDTSNVEFELPEDDYEKFNQFYELVHMMVVDKKIYDEERNLCSILGKKFGYNNIREVIDAIIHYLRNGISSKMARNRVDWLLQ